MAGPHLTFEAPRGGGGHFVDPPPPREGDDMRPREGEPSQYWGGGFQRKGGKASLWCFRLCPPRRRRFVGSWSQAPPPALVARVLSCVVVVVTQRNEQRMQGHKNEDGWWCAQASALAGGAVSVGEWQNIPCFRWSVRWADLYKGKIFDLWENGGNWECEERVLRPIFLPFFSHFCPIFVPFPRPHPATTLHNRRPMCYVPSPPPPPISPHFPRFFSVSPISPIFPDSEILELVSLLAQVPVRHPRPLLRRDIRST